MRTKRYIQNTEGSNYDLSISDLMAALCCIFVLTLIGTTSSLVKNNEKLKEKNLLANEYRRLQKELFLDLENELGEDLKRWNASIDPDTLAIRFSSDAGFAPRSAKLNPNYELVLQEFFPKLVNILKKDKYKPSIEEIQIEGFTAPDITDKYGEGSEHDYTSGIELSQERTKNVLLYCLENTKYSNETDPKKIADEKSWVRTHIVSNGYSLTRPLKSDNRVAGPGDGIDKAKTRRVEFRIKTNDDKIIEQFEEQDGGN